MSVLRVFVPRRPLLPLTRLASGALSASRRPSLAPLFSSSPARHLAPTRARQLATPPPSPAPDDTDEPPPPPPNASLGGRLKHLIKTYGFYALGVYAVLSTLDFGLAFGAINLVGAEHVRALAARAKALVFAPPAPAEEPVEREATGGNEGLWAMVVLAYTVHKTLFLPVRVGLTAAVTPRLVRWLKARGWAGGAGTRRAVQEMRDKVRERRNRD